MTTAPTADQANTVANNLGIPLTVFENSVGLFQSYTVWIVTYTQNDGTITGFRLPADPTADLVSACICRGLAADYGTITVREYATVFTMPTDVTATLPGYSFLANDDEQARVNEPFNWLSPL